MVHTHSMAHRSTKKNRRRRTPFTPPRRHHAARYFLCCVSSPAHRRPGYTPSCFSLLRIFRHFRPFTSRTAVRQNAPPSPPHRHPYHNGGEYRVASDRIRRRRTPEETGTRRKLRHQYENVPHAQVRPEPSRFVPMQVPRRSSRRYAVFAIRRISPPSAEQRRHILTGKRATEEEPGERRRTPACRRAHSRCQKNEWTESPPCLKKRNASSRVICHRIEGLEMSRRHTEPPSAMKEGKPHREWHVHLMAHNTMVR